MVAEASNVAVDAMGGDLGPSEVVAALRLARENLSPNFGVTLVGDEEILRPLVAKEGLASDAAVRVHHAPDVIGMGEKPIPSLKKKTSSMYQMLELVREGRCRAGLSCGNTGSLMAGGTLRLRMLEGVERPALATVIPSKDTHFILLDAGANPTAKPDHLVHNAILGSHYARIALEIDRPRVGLLTIGTEEGKGTEEVAETHQKLKSLGDRIHYVGLTEGFQVFDNHADVLVTDGFTGNLLLKSWENLFHMIKDCLKEEMTRTPLRSLGALLSKGAFQSMKDRLNPEHYGGAPLLGVKRTIIKAHGSSSRTAIMHALRIAIEVVSHDMNARARDDIARANQLLHPVPAEPEAATL